MQYIPAALPRPEQATSTPTKSNGCALPHDPGLDAILADPRLSSSAKLIVLAMVKIWAWYKDHCWPSDATLAAATGLSPGHVGRCLKELEAAGIIKRTRTRYSRTIWLCWRTAPGSAAAAHSTPDSAAAAPDSAPARSHPPATLPGLGASAESDSAPRAGNKLV